MEWLTSFLADLVVVILAKGVESWTPRIVRWLLQHATNNLPEDQRERFGEEWQSHIDDTPGIFGKVSEAFGCLRASRPMSLELAYKAAPWRQRRRYMGVAAAVGVVALVTVRELNIAYEASIGRLEELLDQKDRDLQKKIAEADEAKTQLVDLQRQLEAKDANLSRIQAANAATLSPLGIVVANASPTPSPAESPFTSILTASGLTGSPTATSPTPGLTGASTATLVALLTPSPFETAAAASLRSPGLSGLLTAASALTVRYTP